MTNWHTSFRQLTGLGTEELQALDALAQPKSYKAGDFFSTPHTICRYIGLLDTGIARVYHVHDGKEITDYFNTISRNNFVSSFVSFLRQRPSKEYVEFLIDAEVILISYDNLQQLYTDYKSFERLGRLMAERNYLLALERIESLQYQNATTRYESFLELYPQLINQIPHHYIASYLGVTPESLSRIRKELAR